MAQQLQCKERNAVLLEMAGLIYKNKTAILAANRSDLEAYQGGDLAMYDRLKLDNAKIEGMAGSLEELAAQDDPLGVERYRFTHPNGMEISNRTSAFGTVLIIYESRPDVTIEAAGIAFKSGNSILLKGGKEAQRSNMLLTGLWHQALQSKRLPIEWVTYLEFTREETRAFLENPSQKVDLIVPRGGEQLIAFVKEHASCPVIVSGRGNNFLFVDREASLEMAEELIINAKTTKISACNALDKVLIDRELPEKENFIRRLVSKLQDYQVTILADEKLSHFKLARKPYGTRNFWITGLPWGRWRTWSKPSLSSINTAGGILQSSSPPTATVQIDLWKRWIQRRFTTMPPRALQTAANSGWAGNWPSARISCIRGARLACNTW